jgi:predicted transcriptional regulator
MAEKTPNETAVNDRTMTLVAQIAASYVGHNDVAATDLPQLIATLYQSLTKVGAGASTRPKTVRNRRWRSRNRSSPITSSAWKTARN